MSMHLKRPGRGISTYVSITLLCSLPFLAGCTTEIRQTKSADLELSTQLVGTWEFVPVNATQSWLKAGKYVYKPDGTFTSLAHAAKNGLDVRAEVEGTWRVEDGFVIEQITKTSSVKVVPLGTLTKDKIISLKDGLLSTRDEDGDEWRMRKKRGYAKSPPGPESGPTYPVIAVDGRGLRYLTYQGQDTPWHRDLLQSTNPEYPTTSRARRQEGEGVFRLTIDLKTGLVSNVTIIDSTGVAELDTSSVIALRGWRWRPGAWKSVDVVLRFTLLGQPTPDPFYQYPQPSMSQSLGRGITP